MLLHKRLYVWINSGWSESQPIKVTFGGYPFFPYSPLGFNVTEVHPGHDYCYEIDYISIPTLYFCPGDIFTVTVSLKNIGLSTWYNWGEYSVVRLATGKFKIDDLIIPKDHPSPFYTTDWISPTRATTALEEYVRPGDSGTFQFNIKAPPFNFLDVFTLVSEYTAWFITPSPVPIAIKRIHPICDCTTLDCICRYNAFLCELCTEHPEVCFPLPKPEPPKTEPECPTTDALEGTSLEVEVSTLREFRDKILVLNDLGQCIICKYYKYGPEITMILFEDENIKQIYRDLVAHFLPLVKESIAGVSDWSEKIFTPEETTMLKDFNNALLPYASPELSEFLNKMDVVLESSRSKTLGELVDVVINE